MHWKNCLWFSRQPVIFKTNLENQKARLENQKAYNVSVNCHHCNNGVNVMILNNNSAMVKVEQH